MAEEEPQKEEGAPKEQSPQNSGISLLKNGVMKKISPYLLTMSPFIFYLLIFVMIIALLLAIINSRRPLSVPDFSAEAGNVTCAWSNAPAGYKDYIDAAANKAGIQPALLAAIFWSEHHDGWATPKSDGTWDADGSSQGPYQIVSDNWENWWTQAQDLGLTSKNFSDVDKESVEDSAIAAAGSIENGLKHLAKKIGETIPLNTTDQKYIMYIGMRWNRGEGAADKWATEYNFSLTDAPKNNTHDGWIFGAPVNNSTDIHDQYSFRTWKNFQTLNETCTNASAYGTGGGYLSQCDSKWKDDSNAAKYFPKAKSFCGSGCGTTSGAMVVNAIKNSTVTPNQVAAKFSSCSGSWAAFSPSCLADGFGITYLSSDNITVAKGNQMPTGDVQAELYKGYKAIMRLEPNGEGYIGPKRSSANKYPKSNHDGHYVVVTGISGNNLITNDPTDGEGTLYPTSKSNYDCTLKFFFFK